MIVFYSINFLETPNSEFQIIERTITDDFNRSKIHTIQEACRRGVWNLEQLSGVKNSEIGRAFWIFCCPAFNLHFYTRPLSNQCIINVFKIKK